MLDFQDIIKNGITIKSSGTSGDPKDFFQTPEKIAAANQVAIAAQHISPKSRVYTCCKTTHAGGLLAQTLPALSIGATVDIVPFNAYSFVREIRRYTHTHLTPLHAQAIMMTKGFENLDLSGVWVTCGADPVTWDIIEAFVGRGCTFMVNWGMSEVGPIAINIVFQNIKDVLECKQYAPKDSTIIGSRAWCMFKIVDKELAVKGPICIYNDWYYTNDMVEEINGLLFYKGRKNKEVNLWKPTKG